jgi:hypothetical protein
MASAESEAKAAGSKRQEKRKPAVKSQPVARKRSQPQVEGVAVADDSVSDSEGGEADAPPRSTPAQRRKLGPKQSASKVRPDNQRSAKTRRPLRALGAEQNQSQASEAAPVANEPHEQVEEGDSLRDSRWWPGNWGW